ncbi:MAG TPA: glucosamine-6-phosphate deaminase [Candidatus Onthocola gallistercoris]|uniref:Glucosamine-6-phosphate deaminase n=1 Tax=Candidatus Onthocola gallistercoris TaxID=2840876 RepID=A0A9D1HGF1_9FIRM|nr:glucosamine-6-phosphate deaminase [Candidatus Onthocola gallistercoris]
MRFYCGKDYDEMSRKAANLISAQVLTKPDSVLGLATGSSPIGTYKELIRRYEMGDLDFSSIRTVNLDEYKGLSGDHEQSYRYFMDTHFFDHVNIDKANTNVPNGLAEDTDGECARYDDLIASMGGIDLQLLGIGHNGHIGFNEPEDIFRKETHCVALAESTINANSRLFEKKEDVPRYAFTMGIKNIMMARKIVMVISGEDKADIVAKAFFGPVTPQVPASILQLHPDVSIVGDAAAFSKISL